MAVGTCKMCISCSVLVALEAAGHMHVSVEASCVFQIGLYICQTYTGLKGYIHIGKEFYLYHGHLYIYICMICIREIIYTIYTYRGYAAQ